MASTKPTSSGPRKRRTGSPSRRVLRSAAFLVLFLLAAIILLTAFGILTEIDAPVTTDKHATKILVAIPRGASAREIGDLLQRRHLIRHATGFVLAARLAGIANKMHAGQYEISPAMPPRQIAALIANGLTATDIVVIPEGFTIAQIARRLAEKGMGNEATFLTLARMQGTSFMAAGWQPPKNNLEGYLFPDTYRVPKGTSEREIIAQMLGNFHRRVIVPDAAQIARYPGGLPALVTLASLIEREAEIDEDRPKIAAALTNRLRRGMRLECDATIEYALPEHKSRLYYRDLRVESPYNTYLHAGLPPTPIANPGLPSIQAALNPARVDYLYYVAGPDGHHIFSSTLAAHNRAVALLHAYQRHA